MEVAVEAPADAVLFQHVDDLPALVAPVLGGIVQEHQLLPVPCRLQRCFQTAHLPLEHLGIMLAGLLLFEEPATGAADGKIAVFIEIVVENELILKAVLLAELIKFRGGGPPVVVVALEDDLPSGDLVDPREVLPGVVQSQSPAQIAAEHQGVLLRQNGEALPELVHVTHPGSAEDVHGLLRTQRQVQVTDRI